MAYAPSREDSFVAEVSQLIGGPAGRRARARFGRLNATTVSLLTAIVVWMITVIKQNPCRQTLEGQVPNAFESNCYSDIPLLFTSRGLVDGVTPYLGNGGHALLEYPVGTGWIMELNRLIAVALGAPVGPGLDQLQTMRATNLFYSVNMVVLAGFFFAAVWALSLTVRGRGWDAMMLAASPAVVLTGLINWDLVPVALTALALLLWTREKPAWAGVLLGLGMATKLYPLFLLGPLLMLCLRTRKMREFGLVGAGFAAAWLVLNLPTMILAPDAWLRFWTFNSDRAGDFGSLWYLFVLNNTPVPNLNTVVTGLFVVACLGLAGLILFARRRPRLGQVCFLVLLAFLMTNKVYSPQYVLWLVPLLAMARPVWRDWVIFTAGEWIYVLAIWGHLGQYIGPGDGGADRLFWLATLLRLGTQAYVGVQVVRDILHPERDRVRCGGVDDPSGGVFDQATDATWLPRVRERVLGSELAAPIVPPATTLGTRLPGLRHRIDRWDREGAIWVGSAWLGSRLVLIATGLMVMLTTGRNLSQSFGNWDAAHYVAIAEQGYLADPKRMAFFPGLPMLLKPFVAIGIPGELAGIAISLICSVLAAAALYRLGGVWAAGLWLFAPTAIFTVVPYSEALFCALAFWAWERARSDKWWQAAALAAGACSVRISGLFLVAALVVMILTWHEGADVDNRQRVRAMLRRGMWLVLPLLVVFLYAWFLYGLTGSWNAWYAAQQEGWERALTDPINSFLHTIPAIEPNGQFADKPGWAWVFRFEVVSMIVGVVATVVLVRRKMWAEATWIAIQVAAFGTSYWWFSVNRAVLLWFPVWLLMADLIAQRPATRTGQIAQRVGWGVYLCGSILAMLWWANMFLNGQWAS